MPKFEVEIHFRVIGIRDIEAPTQEEALDLAMSDVSVPDCSVQSEEPEEAHILAEYDEDEIGKESK